MNFESTHKLPLISVRTLLFAVVPLITLGCSGVDVVQMTPNTPTTVVSKIGGSVRVMDVTGGKKTCFGCARMISDDDFKKALVLTLRQSGLFDDVSTDHGDLNLYATIKSQNQSGMAQYTAELLVSYKFTDSAGKVIWFSSYDSEASSRAFSGATRTRHAREGSARANLSSLIQGIREQWPRKSAGP